MAAVRSFVALPLPDEVRIALAEAQKRLRAAAPEVKWEDPAKFHITLKFLGDVEISRLEELALKFASRLNLIRSFDLIYENIGAFPSAEAPRTIWGGTRENGSIVQLHEAVDDVCHAFGFAREARTFHAHATLGRVKKSGALHRLTEEIKNTTLGPIQSRCWGARLVRSELTPTGSVYTTLHSFPFSS